MYYSISCVLVSPETSPATHWNLSLTIIIIIITIKLFYFNLSVYWVYVNFNIIMINCFFFQIYWLLLITW